MAGLMNPGGGPPSGAGLAPAPQDNPPLTDTHQMGEDGRGSGGDGQDTGNEESNVTPQEQAQYDDFVKECLAHIYQRGGQVNPGILKLLDNDPQDLISALGNVGQLAAQSFSPRVALAATAVTIVLEVVEARSANGGQGKPDGEIIFHGGQNVLEDLAQLAGKAGVHNYTQEDVNASMLIAMDIYREAAKAKGLLDENEAKGEWQDIVNADKQGPEALNAMLPGITDRQVDPGNARPAADNQAEGAQA